MIAHLYHKVRFAILKKKIKKNPHIGRENIDGTYDYKQGSYGIRYYITKEASGRESIQLVSRRYHLSPYEQGIKGIKGSLFKFWHYQGWLSFLRPPIIFLLFTSMVVFYFGLMEKQRTKAERFEWIIASVVGISPQQIEYIGDGWLDISGQRKTAVDRIYEPIGYRVNPFRWLFSPEAGFVTRWRGEPYGYATHPVVYNERGDVWINKEGSWLQGKIYGKEIKWDMPQGTGIRAGKVTEHEISTKEDNLHIEDK